MLQRTPGMLFSSARQHLADKMFCCPESANTGKKVFINPDGLSVSERCL
jgi:hypothetical protein